MTDGTKDKYIYYVESDIDRACDATKPEEAQLHAVTGCARIFAGRLTARVTYDHKPSARRIILDGTAILDGALPDGYGRFGTVGYSTVPYSRVVND